MGVRTGGYLVLLPHGLQLAAEGESLLGEPLDFAFEALGERAIRARVVARALGEFRLQLQILLELVHLRAELLDDLLESARPFSVLAELCEEPGVLVLQG